MKLRASVMKMSEEDRLEAALFLLDELEGCVASTADEIRMRFGLRTQAAEVLAHLLNAGDRFSSRYGLHQLLYPLDDECRSEKCVEVALSHARKVFVSLGVDDPIENLHGQGWRLRPAAAAALREALA